MPTINTDKDAIIWNDDTNEYERVGAGTPTVKLYNTGGDNEDGALTQKAATQMIPTIEVRSTAPASTEILPENHFIMVI